MIDLPLNINFALSDLIDKYFVKNDKDEELFKLIYISMAKTLIPKFNRMLSTKVITAEDIYDETWFAILDPSTTPYDSEKGAFIGYFYSIAKNKIYNWNFKKESTNSVDIEQIRDDILKQMEPNKELFNQELKILFYEEINKLSPFQREIIMFRNFGFQYNEISDILNVPQDTLRQRMRTAKDKLRLSKELTEALF